MKIDNGIQLDAIKERVITQLEDFYSGGNWVAENFEQKVFSLPLAKAIIKPDGHSHSVAQLTAHIHAWRNFVLQKLEGNDHFDIEDNSDSDWPPASDWDAIKKDFKNGHQRMIAAIKKFPVEQLKLQVPGRKYSYLFLINGIVEHDYYHYGQIGSVMAALKRNDKVE